MTIHEFRKIVPGVCRCGAPFTGLKTKKHCSERCKQAAKYSRIKALRESALKG